MRRALVLLDTDFDGARLRAACAAHGGRRLHYIALAPRPVDASHLPEEWRMQWPPCVPGLHRMVSRDGLLTLDVLIGEPEACLAQVAARIDEVLLAWVPAAVPLLARLLVDGARLQAVHLDEAQRAALQKNGFVFDESRLRAVFYARRGEHVAAVAPERRAIVIGAGVAGAAACERLAARGWKVTLVERHAQPASEASGNLAGIFMPQLSKDDNIATRLVRAAYLYSLRYWKDLGGIGAAFDGAQCGVLQLARDGAHAQVQRQIAASGLYPRQYARWLDAPEASAMLGAPAPDGAWWFEQGGWARPSSVCAAMLDACGALLTRRFSSSALRLERGDEEWLVRDADGGLIAAAPTVILAAGTGAVDFAQAADLPLDAVRGQVTHLAAGSLPSLPFVACREAYMTPAHEGVVCVGATYDAEADATVRAASQHENIRKIADILDIPVFDAPLAGRTGFRCVAPDRLPLAGALPDPGVPGRCERLRDVPRWPGLFGLLGYASRGLIWAPLAAELLACQLEGEPLPLERQLAEALDPARFLLRERRRAS
ncbi:FAD-dependent 5-carboxymethylaminomethyl-2-thiouridine(34) oxidoreductase MnmC [Janthinobacterium violaceinigrum]|uniref:FAD-dependent 5-carboxymethylaminomethyl-2-thiouridine(34) oxidoreductase MnmC n=1 Tax=Janthinobacterium violaceinigrum TaxID=2654252 RepID=A0A6I1HYP9_9BURK|nr:FAD-dependent 5-carboxymethylaminomethyl-2-thiouridine(34) oxidoreductase MnmC [Janthinobacterium violaceinigrum]KAB8063864.1 FAD-dependent 5-carboxymethylaminomethyl-2-thiouridine(34) oxidoreductase MnmC [Janthinobacterium violaceinigrum]